MKTKISLLTVALVATLLAPGHAATRNWTGNNSTNWNDAGNWDTLPVGNDTLSFGNSTSTYNTFNDFPAGTQFNGTTFTQGTTTNYTLSGNAIKLGGTLQIAAQPASYVLHTVNLDLQLIGNRQMTTRGNGDITVNGNITEDAAGRTLTSGGVGVLYLTGNNSFSGNLLMLGGTVQINTLADTGVSSGAGAGAAINPGNSGTGAILALVAASAQSSNRTILIGSNVANATHTGGATIQNNSANATATLTFTGADFNVAQSTSNAPRTLTLSGTNTGNNTVLGTIRDNSASGIVSLTKSQGGKWILAGNNTYTGNTTISGGILLATKAAALPSYNTANKTIVSGTSTILEVVVGGSNWTTGEIDTLLSNATKTSGALGIDTTNGNLTQWTAFTNTNFGNSWGLAKFGNNTLLLTENNTYNGTTTVTQGTLQVGNNGTSGSVGNGSVVNNAELLFSRSDALSVAGDISGTGSLVKTGAGVLTLAGANTYSGPTTIEQGAVLFNTTGSTLTSSTNAGTTVQSGGQLRVNIGNIRVQQNITISGIGLGTSGGAIGALGGQVNSGNWTYNGTITLNGGATIGAFNAGTSKLTINKGIIGTGDLTLRSGSANNGDCNFYLLGQSSYTGNTVFSTSNVDGTVTVRNGIDNALPTGSALFMNGTAGGANTTVTYVLNGYNQTVAGLSGTNGVNGSKIFINSIVGANASLSTLAVNSTADFIFNGTIGGNGTLGVNSTDENNLALVKNGPGSLALGGENTYNGTTTVNAGTLRINGNQTAATGDVLVASGATLGGSGIIGGNITLNGTVSPGNSVGESTAAANVTLNDGSAYRWEISDWSGAAGTGYDHLAVNGETSASGNFTIQIVENSLVNFTNNNSTFTIATFNGNFSGTPSLIIDSAAFTSGNGTWTAQPSGNTLQLLYTVTGGGGPTANVTFTSASQSVAETAGTAVLTVTATGTPTGTITANVTFDSGNSTATTGDIGGYTTQTVTLNASNSYTANVTVTVTNDVAPEANETAVFDLTDLTGSAVLGSPASHSLTILANDSFASWAAGYGVTANMSANNDTDKFTNGEEYAFDLDPTVKEYGNVLASQTALSGGNVTMTMAFNGNSSKQDINYVVRRANNPGFTSNTIVGFWNGTNNWTTSNSTYFGNETQTGAGDVKAINVNMSIPAATEPRQFLKVNIE